MFSIFRLLCRSFKTDWSTGTLGSPIGAISEGMIGASDELTGAAYWKSFAGAEGCTSSSSSISIT
jgi:hypothetical protein